VGKAASGTGGVFGGGVGAATPSTGVYSYSCQPLSEGEARARLGLALEDMNALTVDSAPITDLIPLAVSAIRDGRFFFTLSLAAVGAAPSPGGGGTSAMALRWPSSASQDRYRRCRSLLSQYSRLCSCVVGPLGV
jgi:hypothetical protein